MTKGELTKRLIIDAAQKYFIEFGYNQTRMVDIANKVKIDRRTVYRHFDSKETLILEILNKLYKDFTSHIEKVYLNGCQNAFEKITLMLEEYSNYFKNHIDMILITGMFDLNVSNITKDSRLYNEFIEHAGKPDIILTKLISEGLADKSIKTTIKPSLLAVTINNSLLSLAERSISFKEKLDKEQGFESWVMVERLGELILEAIKN